jgi:asparagine synthase (glutamine-hydrolysing)
MATELRTANGDTDPYERLFNSLDAGAKIRGREPAKQLIYLWLKTVFPGYILAADRADMAHSVEVRLPFLDHVLFERLREVPVEMLAYGGENKHLLRESASRYLSPPTRTRAKKPLMAPPFTPRRGKLYTVINDVVRSEAMRDVPFFSANKVVELADNAHRQNGDGRASADPLLIMAASTCILQQAYRL